MARDCVERHSAMIYDRGGVRRIFDLSDIGSVRWGRQLDEKSSAEVTIQSWSCAGQLPVLRSITPRRHELVIFLAGQRVWEGPIEEVAWTSRGVRISAFDVKHYFDHTPLTRDWPNPDRGGQPMMTNRIEDILNYELVTPYNATVTEGGQTVNKLIPRWEGIDPPINVLPHLDIRHGTVLTRVDTTAFQMQLGEHLDRLAESGMDWTTVGRRLVIWDSADAISRLRTLTEADFSGDLDVFESGSDYASILHVTASQQGEEGEEGEDDLLVVGSDGGADPFFGPWAHLASSQSEGEDTPSQEALNSQAYRQRLWRREIPVELRVPSGVGVTLSSSLTMQQLVAGAEVPVRAVWNQREVAQLQRLTEVTVTEDSSGLAIGLTMLPSGTTYEVV